MLNPFGRDNDPNSYFALHKKILRRFRSAKADDQIVAIVRENYDAALTSENIVLSKIERNRLLNNILKLVLEDVTKKIHEGS